MSDAIKHIIALSTYGTKVKQAGSRRVSALKVGYMGVIAKVLLALLPDAKDVSSKRDRYVYIHVPNKPKLHHNWLFVEVDAEELKRVEQITIGQASNRGIARWRDSTWQMFPCKTNPQYQEASSAYDVPKGSPIGYWAINSDGEKGATGGDSRNRLIAQYSKLSDDKPAWWWLPGNDATYEHRFALKRAGCRWKRNRRSYAYVGDKLPESLLDLLDNADECRAIMNGMNPDEAKRKYRYGDASVELQNSEIPIQAVINSILSDISIVEYSIDQQPIIHTHKEIVAGRTEVGQGDTAKNIWYISGNLSLDEIDRLKKTSATHSIGTRCWLIEDEEELDALDSFFAQHEANGADENEPCSLEEAADALCMQVIRDEPASAYKRGRRAWTVRELPAGIAGHKNAIPAATEYVIADIDFSDDPKNPVYIIEYGDGETARVEEEELIPQRLFALGDIVYARQKSETSDGKHIKTGTKGTISKLYRFNPNLGSLRGHTYDVLWDDVGEEWMFEAELTPEKLPSGIAITHGRIVPEGSTITIADERRAIIDTNNKPEALRASVAKTYECVCEESDGPKGWLPAENLGTWVACGVCNPNGSNIPQSDPSNPDAEKLPTVRLIQAAKLADNSESDDKISHAIRHASKSSIQTTAINSALTEHTQTIPMEYVGELTGSVIANVFCYGYATDAGELIYLNMGGPRSGVEAIRAKLGKGESVNLIPDDAPAIELGAGEGNTGMYTAIMTNMSEVRFLHCILIHEKMTEPNYNGKAKTYIFEVNEQQAKGQVLHHIRETVNLPVFDEWVDYLWVAGETAMLVRNCQTDGGAIVKSVDLDNDAWNRLITGGIANDIIRIPSKETV